MSDMSWDGQHHHSRRFSSLTQEDEVKVSVTSWDGQHITHGAFHHLLQKTTSSATASGRALMLPAAHTSHRSVGGDRSTWRSCLTSPRGSGQDVETSARSRWHPDPRAWCTISHAHLFDQRELIVFSLIFIFFSNCDKNFWIHFWVL